MRCWASVLRGPVSGQPKLAEGCMRWDTSVLRGWRANPGRGFGAILAKCKQKSSPAGELLSWFCCLARQRNLGAQALGQRKAPLVQRGDSMATPCRGDCEARQMIQLGAVIGCGSTAWPWRLATGVTLPLGNKKALLFRRAFFLCTRLGLHQGFFRVMVYHTRSSKPGSASPPETGTGAAARR